MTHRRCQGAAKVLAPLQCPGCCERSQNSSAVIDPLDVARQHGSPLLAIEISTLSGTHYPMWLMEYDSVWLSSKNHGFSERSSTLSLTPIMRQEAGTRQEDSQIVDTTAGVFHQLASRCVKKGLGHRVINIWPFGTSNEDIQCLFKLGYPVAS